MMDFLDQKVRSLLRIVELGNFTKAAQELCITQPAISRQIKLLEDEVGFKILERSQSGIHPTKKGAILIDSLTKMDRIAKNMTKMILDEHFSGVPINVGITHTVESSLVVEAIAKYIKDSSSDMSTKIITNTSDYLYKMLKDRELDFIVMEGKYSDPDLKTVLLGTDCLVLVTSPESPLANKGTVTLDELNTENFIMRLPSSNTMKTFSQALAEKGRSIHELNVILELENIATIKDLIRRNFGVSILSKSTCLDELKKGKIAVLNIEGISMIREVNIVYPMDFEYQETIQGILQCYNSL